MVEKERQKYRVFPRHHSSTRLLNSLYVIEDKEGKEVEEPQMAVVISDYFGDIFKSNGNTNFSAIAGILSCKVTEEMNSSLTTIPSDSEIRQAAMSINGGKDPGSDGNSAKFYHSYWHIVGDDFIQDVRQFFTEDHLHPQQNETHIRLIPKVTGPWNVADYRPIALC